MPRTRFSAVVYLLVVFVSGIVLGGFATRYYTAKASVQPVAAPRTMAEFRKTYMEQMRAKVGISDDQAAQVNRILDDTKKKFDELRKQEKPHRDQIQQEQIDSIRAVLNKDQIAAYESWRAERQKAQQLRQGRKSEATGN